MNVFQLSMAAALACALTGPALADTLNFSYKFGSGNVLSGALSGTDAGNTFTVTGLRALTLNGVDARVTSALVYSVDNLVGLGGGFHRDGSAVVTIDGSYMDLVITPDGGSSGFDFILGDLYDSRSLGFAAYLLPSVGADADFFAPSRWIASVDLAPIPEPASLAILGAGAAGMFFARRRCNAAVLSPSI